MKIRFAFATFLIISLFILIYYNYRHIESASDYSRQIEMVVFIFFAAIICASYIAYECYRVMYSEMTERMTMITESKNDLQTAYNSLSMFMIEITEDFTIVNANEAVCRYLGRKHFYIVGKSLDSVLDFNSEAISTLKDTIHESFSLNSNEKKEIETKNCIFEVFAFPMQQTSGKLKRVLLVLNDVTQVRAMYRQTLQDNKMTAIGQLAAGVAHEIRNPLGLIRNYCHLLKKNTMENEEQKNKAISMMEGAVDRSSEIIDNLLRFSRISNEICREVNLKKAILGILSFEEHTLIKKNINVVLNCNEEINLYLIQESLDIIIINLIINAVDAMENGGEIKIDCVRGPETVTISISDTGIGISKEIMASIFNPFFTTKYNRNGGGLGLYIVYNETSKLNGTICVESEIGQGAKFILQLPARTGEEFHE